MVIAEDLRAISGDQASLLADAANHSHSPAYASENCDGFFFKIEEGNRAGMQLLRGERVSMCACLNHRLIMDPSTSRRTKDDICLLISSQLPLQVCENISHFVPA